MGGGVFPFEAVGGSTRMRLGMDAGAHVQTRKLGYICVWHSCAFPSYIVIMHGVNMQTMPQVPTGSPKVWYACRHADARATHADNVFGPAVLDQLCDACKVW